MKQDELPSAIQSDLPAAYVQVSSPESPTVFDNREWLNTREAACYLRLTPAVLLNLSSNGRVPFYKLGRSNRYLRTELRDLLLRNRRGVSDGI